MKVTIEKKIESLEDLRLAKAHLKAKSEAQKQKITSDITNLYEGVSAQRVYQESLESFGFDNLVTLGLPHLLKFAENFELGAVRERIGSAVKSRKWTLTAMLVALGLGGFWAYRRTGNDSEVN